MPSSISTSATLPVTFEETVAWRRATTYPDAFSTAALLPPPLDDDCTAVAVSTSIAFSRNSAYKPTPIASASAPTTSHLYRGLGPVLRGSLLRSMRRLSRAFWSKAM